METYLASAERNTYSDLRRKIEIINNSPIMRAILNSVNVLLAVVDEYRQIVSVNDIYLKTMGFGNADEILGMRPGESFHCINSTGEPNGCGTTKKCRQCGSTKALIESLLEKKGSQGECSITTVEGNSTGDLYFHVKCEPVTIEETTFTLLFLQDKTVDQRRKMLERAFFHDFSNMLGGLSAASYLLSNGAIDEEIIKSIGTSTTILVKELEIQRILMNNDLDYYQKSTSLVTPEMIFEKLDILFRDKAASQGKTIVYRNSGDSGDFETDEILLLRILSNMMTNALEATKEKGRIIVFTEKGEGFKKISVHNNGYIPDEIQLKIFERNFSTKAGSGRGIGTYSMKLFGEKVLGGEIGFLTTREWGTEFYLKLPC